MPQETRTHFIQVTTKNEEETQHVAGDIEDRLDSFVVEARELDPEELADLVMPQVRERLASSNCQCNRPCAGTMHVHFHGDTFARDTFGL